MCQIYVDDIIFGSTNQKFGEEFGKMMTKEFEMSMIRELSYFIGLQIKQLKSDTFVYQAKYINNMLNKFRMEDAKPIRTPMAANGHLDLNENGEPVDQKVYILVYDECLLSTYRPDIMFTVCTCARFQASPKECHLTTTMKGILTYLKRIHIVLFVVPKRCTI